MTDLFYPVTPDMPGIGVRVVVIREGREFKAARTVDKNARAVRWATEQDGKLVWLRGDPDCWRPEQPDKWKAPLPEPLDTREPEFVARMRSVEARKVDVEREDFVCTLGNRYSAMSAQAEQSAQTRAALVAEFGEIEDAPAVADKLWWMSEKLTYSPRGSISEREAEGRVARAILTDGIRSSYGGPRRHRETSSALSQFIHSALLSTDAEHMIEHFEPTPRDLSDYDTAFGWFADLNPPRAKASGRVTWEIGHEQEVLVWRVTGSSWRELASLAGGSHTGAKKVYGRVIRAVTTIANRAPFDRTADVRERSRLHRTRADGGVVDG